MAAGKYSESNILPLPQSSYEQRGLHYFHQVLLLPATIIGHRWVENIPVAERAVEVWPMLQTFVDAVKKVSNPNTASYERRQKGKGGALNRCVQYLAKSYG